MWLLSTWETPCLHEHLSGDEQGVPMFRTIRRQPESGRWSREHVDKLTGDPFNPKRKSSTAMGCGDLPVDLQWGRCTQKRWYVTEALVREHGRTLGCRVARAESAYTKVECRGRDRRSQCRSQGGQQRSTEASAKSTGGDESC